MSVIAVGSYCRIMLMKVKRIVANIATTDIRKAKPFYGDVLGLDLAMNLGWIATFTSNEEMKPQVSFAIEGGLERRSLTCPSK